MTIPVLIGMVFVIIGEMFHVRISLNSVLLLLLVNFIRGFRLDFQYVSIENFKSNLVHFHGFQLLALPSYFIEISFFVFPKRINLLILKYSSDRLVIVAKGFLKLPNLQMLIKQKSLYLPRNVTLVTLANC